MDWVKTKNGYFAVERAKDMVWLHCTNNPKNISWQMQQFKAKDEQAAIDFEARLKIQMERIKN